MDGCVEMKRNPGLITEQTWINQDMFREALSPTKPTAHLQPPAPGPLGVSLPMAGRWNKVGFQVPSNPHHPVES